MSFLPRFARSCRNRHALPISCELKCVQGPISSVRYQVFLLSAAQVPGNASTGTGYHQKRAPFALLKGSESYASLLMD